MKKGLLMLGLLLSGTAHAQLSVRAGGNVGTLASSQNTPDRYAKASAATGFHLGLAYEQKLAGRWRLLPELSYRRQGVDVVLSDDRIIDASYAAHYHLVLHYLSLPVMARAYFGRVYVEAGPYGSFQLAAHEQGTEERGTIAGAFATAINRPATDRYRRFDAGLSAGAGVQLPGRLAVGIRASTGLLSLTPNQEYFFYSGTLKNQVLEASLSYSFRKEPLD